jgi:3-hydroxybutyryl-CoA dehydrogenase
MAAAPPSAPPKPASPTLVLIDLALDYTQATRLAVSVAHSCFAPAAAAAVGLLQAAGFAVSRFADVPGLAVMRTVAMLANEAADAVNQGVCDARAPTRRCGSASITPRGRWPGPTPSASGDLPGAANLGAFYGEDRYRVSPLIQQSVFAGKGIHD